MTHISLSKADLELIKRAQIYCIERKKNNEVIFCPFDMYMEHEENPPLEIDKICRICHLWMETNPEKYTHPCNALELKEALKRFWRKVEI